ncbi:tRNA 2-selenouridine(34) synthase MnmH [Pontibacter sp. HSC-36F09]|uniref:tRNA 2-selenouridine(34) synthase MnmH n=1 Tax=Pontibacter sp. HSC-36F09 TaxID=2910966 RepID=UPI00209F3677|nr:tRNA 2-selenouridine(34) synthase MnmH [Pontibacter sp. HSC-36F09]MCP2045679.1 tRNA 2-selenouridine synthase [Pontibacter sp. HSC-36F09]
MRYTLGWKIRSSYTCVNLNKVAKTITIQEFLAKAKQLPVLDARAPKEYAIGRIPQALSFPIFSDEERATVGAAYKQQGHDPAVLIGLDLFGPKMSGFVREAEKLAPTKEVLVHCWRGGMRSSAMAWLLDFAGFQVYLLQGGYKAYRQYMHEQFERERPLLIISGNTGSGKTDLLPYLQQHSQQVIDLEGLASHKGSSFGGIGMEPQPSTEHFENLLGMAMLELDDQKPLWLEDESIGIGKVQLPKPLYNRMQVSPTIVLDVPKSLRIQKLAEEYCCTDRVVLESAILRIKKRLGGLATKEAIEAISAGDMEKMVDIALTYYDKAYTYELAKKQSVLRLPLETLNPEENAQRLIEFAKQQKLI